MNTKTDTKIDMRTKVENMNVMQKPDGSYVYLDNNATTPMDPRVFEAMEPYFVQKFGNAASRSHHFGWEAEDAVDLARNQMMRAIGAVDPKEIIWTSGATESNNIAILGAAEMHKEKGNHIITQAIEHKAVLDPCKYLESKGFQVTYLPVDKFGQINLADLENAITDKTILISIMHANNEIGTIQKISDIGAIAAKHNVLFHTDASQTLGKLEIDVEKMNIHLLSGSGHKVYGPKGIGMLYVRRRNPRVKLSPIIFGGGHERGLRSGTLNVPGIVGFGKAVELAVQERDVETKRIQKLRDKLKDRFFSELDEIYLNGHPTERLVHNLNISFAFVEGESLMMGINHVAVSSGSACTSASLEPSYVLKGLGIGDELAHTSIRFSLGRFNTEADIDFVADEVIKTVKKLRDMSPLYEMFKEGIDISKIQWAKH